MKQHQANWLRRSATTAAQCALERFERMKAQADAALAESNAAHAFYLVIEGLSRDWARNPDEDRKRGPVSRWYMQRDWKSFWPSELSGFDPLTHEPTAAPFRPMEDCPRHECTRCKTPAYVVHNERDLGEAPSYDSCIEYSKHLLCIRCRTVTRVPPAQEHAIVEV